MKEEKQPEYVTKERFEKMAHFFLREISKLKADYAKLLQDYCQQHQYMVETGITANIASSEIEYLSYDKAEEYDYYDECILPYLQELYEENPELLPDDCIEVYKLPEYILDKVQAYTNDRRKGEYGRFAAWYKKNLPIIKEHEKDLDI